MCSNFGNAQLKQKLADELFEQETYYKAVPMYVELAKKDLKKQTGNYENVRKLAQAYTKLMEYQKAANQYAILQTAEQLSEQDYVEYISVLRILRQYPFASDLTAQAFRKYPNNALIKDWYEHKDVLAKLYTSVTRYQVEDTKVNSGKGDFAPSYYNGDIIYASKSVKKGFLVGTYNWDNSNFINLFKAEEKNGQLDKGKRLKDAFFSRMHDGPISFDSTYTMAFLTRNDMGSKKGKEFIHLSLYTMVRNGEEWSEPVAFPYNDPSYNLGHAVMDHEQRGIYFVSDMPGGVGGTDIYYSAYRDGQWEKPVNLGTTINTTRDEMFPFVAADGTLYFASNGHYGLGGLDVFRYNLGEEKAVVENLGAPINSSADDFSFILHPSLTKGYFTSNRDGFVDRIYSWKGEAKRHKYHIAGRVKNMETKESIDSATVMVWADHLEQSYLSDNGGLFSTNLLDDAKYGDQPFIRFEIRKEGFSSTVLSMKQLLMDQDTIFVDFELEPFAIGSDLGKTVGINQIYYDLDKSNIRPDAALELDKIIQVLNNNPKMVIELSSHTDCRQTYEYNMALSERRAQSAAEYLRARIVNPHRIISKGYGELKPVNHCECEGDYMVPCTEAEHQANRRTEFIIISK